MARIGVTDGDQRAALAVTRSLGRAGHEVVVFSRSGRSLAGASRYARWDSRTPDPLAAPDAFSAELGKQVRASGIEILIPVTEASLLAVLPGAGSLPCLVPFPDFETFHLASDKAWVARTAEEVGIAVPDQVVVPEPGWTGDLPGDPGLSFVLKPFRSVEGGRKLSVSYAAGGRGLREAIAGLPREAFPLLVQRRVLGPGAGVFLLVWNGRVHAVFGHKRIREKPPSGGVSVVRESAVVDPDLVQAAGRLLQRLDWRGVAMVEFKVDAVTQVPYLMEINGRFWGSLQLAVDAGVDFPRLLVEAALGSRLGDPPEYRDGVRCRWLLGDLDQLLARLRHSPSRLDLPPGAPGRILALMEFLSDFRRGTKLEVLRVDDPRPFFAELLGWARALWGGR